MCGIIGYCGSKQVRPILLDGLKKLEYRGYDSVGIVCSNIEREEDNNTRTTETFHVCKEVGKVADLERVCNEDSFVGTVGLGHCRWATHGAVTWNNAHPHTSSNGQVVLVHNGIIENYLELQAMLVTKGFSFSSESDTEVVANLLAYLITNPKELADSPDTESLYVRAMLSLKTWLKGAYALAVIFADCPNEIFAIRCESPLVVGQAHESLFLASDIIPLSGYVNKVMYLENHELAYLSTTDGTCYILQCFSPEGTHTPLRLQECSDNVETVDKMGYAHFMLKEMHEQPGIFSAMYNRYIDSQHMPSKFNFNDIQKDILTNIERIIFVSCGTSYHASLYAASLFEQYTNIPATVEYASEFRYRYPVITNHTLIIALSQSGETADTLAAVNFAKERGAKTLGIVNVPTSSIARASDIALNIGCGPEIGVASTKAYTAQMVLLYYLVLCMSDLQGRIEKKELQTLVAHSKQLSKLSQEIFSHSAVIKELGRAYAGYQHMLYLGRGLMYPASLEGALKLKELSYIHAEGYAAAEMKHGPIALIDSTMPIVVLAPQHDVLYEKIHSNIAEIKARGGRVLVLISKGSEALDICDDIFEVPSISEQLDPILFALPLQLFSYYVAVSKGFDPDQPRNLAKSVTVE